MFLEGIKINKFKFGLIFIFTVIFSILLLGGVYAEDMGVNGTQNDSNFDAIQNLIDSTSSGDSIYLENKTYQGNGSAITINKDINIYGSGSSDTILDANRKSNILVISSGATVNLVGLTFTNGYSLEDGGAINNAGKLSIYNSTIVNNYAESGAVHNSYKGELNVYNSLFDSNAASFGAAIDDNEGDLMVVNSTFTNNSCLEGGAIYKRFGNFLIYDSTFINNSAARGGGVYNNRGILRIYNSRFYSNFAYDLGGGIKSWGYCEAYDTIVQNNTGDCGGGFFVSEFTLTIDNCIIDNNTARKGGGVYVEAKGEAFITNSIITNNSAYRGGGIDVNQGSVSLSDSIVSGNVATTNGGGVYCTAFSSDIRNSIINNNSAKNGGGIYVKDVSVIVKNTTIDFNSAENGGGVYNAGSLALTDINMNSNRANTNGGAIYNTNSFILANSIVNKNYAPVKGGAIYNEADLTIADSNFKYNEAMFGGVIYTSSLVSVRNSEFAQNSASQAAGIYTTSNLVVDNCQFLNNKVTRNSCVLYILKDNVNITNSLFKSNTGADEGGCIFINKNAIVYINSTKFISNDAKSYGAAIDNSGTLTIENSLFDDNEAYGAGAIDNGGSLTIISSNFTNNKATNNGGAIDNKGELTVIGSVFENNAASGDGGAIIARRGMDVSYSAFFNNHDKNGYAIFNNTLDNVSISNNWWGLNDSKFENLLNFNTSDDFTWLVMTVLNTTLLIQSKNANIVISFEGMNKSNSPVKLNLQELLPIFNVKVSNGDTLSVENGYLSKSIKMPSTTSITFKLDGESISLKVDGNPAIIKRITNNKNVVVDYNGKATFKVRVIGDDGRPVGKGVVIYMKVGKVTYRVTTDANGYATKVFNFVGRYVITTTYKGYSVKNSLTINKVLKALSVAKKKAKIINYAASLKTSKGKAISGKMVTFKIKGKTFHVKTNKKGMAFISLKNLKVGKYLIVVKYLNSQVKAVLDVRK